LKANPSLFSVPSAPSCQAQSEGAGQLEDQATLLSHSATHWRRALNALAITGVLPKDASGLTIIACEDDTDAPALIS
jgi:hypothetical protein